MCPTAHAGWAPTRTPTAACCCATCPCRPWSGSPSPSKSPARQRTNPPVSSATCSQQVMADTARAARLPARRPGRDRLQPPPGRLRGQRQGVAGPGTVHATNTWTAHGRVMEILSEHTCQGWLEGYLLTGRHGLFSCYEAFVHIVDSMATSTSSGCASPADCPGAARSPPSTTCSPRTCGARTTTASPIRTPASSTTCSTSRPR